MLRKLSLCYSIMYYYNGGNLACFGSLIQMLRHLQSSWRYIHSEFFWLHLFLYLLVSWAWWYCPFTQFTNRWIRWKISELFCAPQLCTLIGIHIRAVLIDDWLSVMKVILPDDDRLMWNHQLSVPLDWDNLSLQQNDQTYFWQYFNMYIVEKERYQHRVSADIQWYRALSAMPSKSMAWLACNVNVYQNS